MRPSPIAAQSLVGRVVAGRYRIIQLLGSGGTGDVYLAELSDSLVPGKKPGPRARFSLKVLRAEHRAEPELRARFEREAVAAALVRHPSVLAVQGEPQSFEDMLFFVMELLVGLDLADTLAFARALAPARAARIAAGAAEGLAAAHEAGVIHRDVKPENIFLVHAPDGREQVKLVDFGFSFLPGDPVEAGAEAARTVVGTPEYMAPEQARGAPAHPSADIYSLGVVLYEMLGGRVPFTGEYPAIALRHARELPPPLLGPGGVPLPNELEKVVLRALAKDPAQRFPSMAALRAALLAAQPPEG